MRSTHRTQKGFTLMELMVVIVIVAILAAVAVPLYINYVKDAQRTEAKGAIGAVITAQQAYFQSTGGSGYANDLGTLETAGRVDVTEAKINWTIVTTATGTGSGAAFHVDATGKGGKSTEGLKVTYDFSRATGGEWDKPAGGGP